MAKPSSGGRDNEENRVYKRCPVRHLSTLTAQVNCTPVTLVTLRTTIADHHRHSVHSELDSAARHVTSLSASRAPRRYRRAGAGYSVAFPSPAYRLPKSSEEAAAVLIQHVRPSGTSSSLSLTVCLKWRVKTASRFKAQTEATCGLSRPRLLTQDPPKSPSVLTTSTTARHQTPLPPQPEPHSSLTSI